MKPGKLTACTQSVGIDKDARLETKEGSVAMLEISPAKVAHVILKAREYDAKVATWDENEKEGDAEEDPQSILEDYATNSTRPELASFIAALNEDEQANLVALMWVGRGTYSSDQFDEAVETAKSERVTATENYLLGTPLLGDYLAEGLEQMGINEISAEEEILGNEEAGGSRET